jgi:cytochrome c553
MTRAYRYILVWMLLLDAGIASSADPVTPDRFAYCTVCHGTAFQGNRSLNAPNLSVLQPWYIELQLMNYKKMIRGGPDSENYAREMQQMVGALDEDAIREVSTYIGVLSQKPALPTVSGDLVRGENLYRGCIACHGEKGRGNAALRAPGLAGQHDWYLERQFAGYRDGVRGTREGDVYGAQMRASVSILIDDESVRDVLVYINTLK